MSIIRRISFSPEKQITAQKVQSVGNYLWIAFAKRNAACLLNKTWAFEPSQIFFSISRDVDKIVKMDLDATYLYVAYEDDELLGERFNLINPLTTSTEILIPVGINEYPVDVKVTATNLFYLLPGNLSGTNAKILRYNLSGVLQQTIDLDKSGSTVINASTMVIDSLGDIWIVTYESPSNLVRVHDLGGNNWDFEITEIN